MLVPMPWTGTPDQCQFDVVDWMRHLPISTYLALWLRWPTLDLPSNQNAYVVSFHLEAVDCDWLDRQAARISAPIVVLYDGQYYDWPHADNIIPVTYCYWHKQIEKMLQWFGPVKEIKRSKPHKASAFCSRITQSKLLVFAALAEYVGIDNCLLVLSTWLEEKNVHYRQPCGNQTLDDLSDIFWTKYFGLTLQQDDYTQEKNHQSFTANFHTPAYQDCALHFTNESYHYSFMDGHIRPGPFLTEKTLKCLAAGQTFVPVGQFDTYGALARLGFRFDYGFDTSWDNDPGNLTRLESIINLIKQLQHLTPNDIISYTIESTQHNLDHINSRKFFHICEEINQRSIQKIFSLL